MIITNLKLNKINTRLNMIDIKEYELKNNIIAIENKIKILLEIQENNQKKLIRLENKINDNQNKLEAKLLKINNVINNKLDNLLNIINKDLKKSCEKMNSHINFIESVYENLKAPINYISNKFNTLIMLENN